MRVLAFATGATLFFAAQASAADARVDARFERILQRLEPTERLEQLCDYTAMTSIRNDARHFRPDRAVAGARSEPRLSKDTVEAKGGAFRSHGKWYEMSYSCTGTPDHMQVVSFKYTIGAEIPETKWAGYGLWQ